MSEESVNATTTIKATAEAVFDVLANPARHAAIDGTGWVCDPVDKDPLTSTGQIFRMGMYHPLHPDGNYEMANEVIACEPSSAISWRPGYVADDAGNLAFGGWTWGYVLTPKGDDETEVTLTYDWSETSQETRDHFQFPPFPDDHLDNSLAHLATLASS